MCSRRAASCEQQGGSVVSLEEEEVAGLCGLGASIVGSSGRWMTDNDKHREDKKTRKG